jgi:glyoxylase-like metal-dependent hydrolase (beta-lactamase superfamily II)
VTHGPTLGHVVANLAAIGVAPDDIDLILLTHLHPDHANGLIDGAGQPIYPRAELVLHERELNFFLDDDSPSRSPAETQGFFAEAKAAIAPYRDRIRTIRDGPVLGGITAVLHPGHTPGQTGWMLDSEGQQLLIWGDIVHMPGVQLPAPEAGTVLDVDPTQAIATRRRTLDMAAADRFRVAGIHLDFPAFGHVAKAGDGYRFIPDVWSSLPVKAG